jgi:peroxiredoxin
MQRDSAEFKLSVGDKAPYFSLPATDGKIYSLADYNQARGLVVIFTSNHCPFAQAYDQRIIDLAMRFQPHGVGFVLICSNDSEGFPEDNFENMVRKSERYGFAVPYLQDNSQSVAKAYDAACTPETYVFDDELRLTYHGSIDDNFEDPEHVECRYLEDALEALINGMLPQKSLTQVIGCSIKWRG